MDLCAPAIEDAWLNAERNNIRPLMPRAPGAVPPNSVAVDAATAGKAYFICARAEALTEGILQSGWRGANESAAITGEEGDAKAATAAVAQRGLSRELAGLRVFVAGKRLLAVVDPPREVNMFFDLL